MARIGKGTGSPTLTPAQERARRSVAEFRKLVPTLTGYAKNLTGRKDVKVQMTSEGAHTDGKTIFIRPPLSLGDLESVRHDKNLCDKRDPATLALLCAACETREDILASVYHEISHIAFDTFLSLGNEDIEAALHMIEQYAPEWYFKAVTDRMRIAKYRVQIKDFLMLAHVVNPYFKGLLNGLEDTRINERMAQARPGTRIMQQAKIYKVAVNGVEHKDWTGAAKYVRWSEYDLNMQASIGLFCLSSGYKIDGWFGEKVEKALHDEQIISLCKDVRVLPTAKQVFGRGFEIFMRMREFGFFITTDEELPPPPEPEIEPEPESEPEEAQSDESGESSESDGSEESDQDDAEGSESDTGGADSGEDAGSADGDDPSGDTSDDADAESAESAGGDGGEQDSGSPSGDADSGGEGDADEAGGTDGSDEASSGTDAAGPGGDDSRGEDESPAGTDSPEASDDSVEAEGGEAPDSDGGADESGEGDDAGTDSGSADSASGSGEAGEPGGDSSSGTTGSEAADGDGSGGDSVAGGGDADQPGGDDLGGPGHTGGDDEDDASEQPYADGQGDRREHDADASEDASGSGQGEAEELPGSDESGDSSESDSSGSGHGDGSADGDGPENGEGSSDEDTDSGDIGASGDSDGGADSSDADVPEGDGGSEAQGPSGEDAGTEAGSDPGADTSGTDRGEPSRGEAGAEEAGEGLGDGGADQEGGDAAGQGEGSEQADVDPLDYQPDEALDGTDGPGTDMVPPTIDSNTYIELVDMGLHDEHDEHDELTHAEEVELESAIVQGVYFTKPSVHITGLHVWRYADRDADAGKRPWHAWGGAWLGVYGKQGKAEIEPVGEMVLGPALMKLRVAFSDNRRTQRNRNQRAGRIDTRALGKRAWGNDDRLFGRKVVPGKKDYFVVIGLDISGSTVGVNLKMIKEAALAQAELCDRLGVKFAVYAHTGSPLNSDKVDTRYVDIYEIKSADQMWDNTTRAALAEIGPSSANLDGHTLEFYRKVADSEKATNKVILYYTDGAMPLENYNEELEILQREIALIRQKKITLLGVGVRTDSPTKHGLDTVQINDPSEVGKVVAHLERVLIP